MAFADGYPLLLATEESLAALNELIAQGSKADEGPLSMTRFRPNLVVAGAPAWTEDGWRRLRVGEATFLAVKGCARCAIPTTDEVTAVRYKEPTVHPGPAPALGRRGVVRDEPGRRRPRARRCTSATRSRSSRSSTPPTARRADRRGAGQSLKCRARAKQNSP